VCQHRLGYNIKKQMKEDVLYKDRDSQIKAIGETFELVKKPVSATLHLLSIYLQLYSATEAFSNVIGRSSNEKIGL